ncbi:hypothetical protein AF332_11560 [Sporosarcina globispora]|uniref:Uncharacterized protein n=1 Tax=Sporosarcina globispora TaxID=1459 RepID=A0A0M0GC19_SPOGL|nr:hypothetical protein [Sporosarcina globispora]KON87399.1 hypothetical protein AF332_11560 [Sporosarcina globispora]
MKNTEYTLRKLQAAYLKVTLRKEMGNNEETCMYCWNSGCGCDSKSNVKTDSFISLTTASEFKYA